MLSDRWKKRNNAKTIFDVFIQSSGETREKLLFPTATLPSEIGGLESAVKIIKDAVVKNTKISIVGDYDADGVCGTSILFLLLNHLGVKANIRIPYRMSEGYGLSQTIINEVCENNPMGLLITVDNGIASQKEIDFARNNGMTVIIIDHHLQNGPLPNAHVIIDQHIKDVASNTNNHNKKAFTHYCGAGLALKLSQYILNEIPSDENDQLLDKLIAIAAIGTVADVVPLLGDNRIIVKKGIQAINKGDITAGLKAILDVCDLSNIKSSDIGYKLAPLINASGRLVDDGARLPCALLSTTCGGNLSSHAAALHELNEQRKALVNEQVVKVMQRLEKQKITAAPIIVMEKSIHEGIVGIIAGQLAEKFKAPTIVLTKTKQNNWKGSARSYGEYDLKKALDKMSDVMINYGGHAGAAGLSVQQGKESDFIAAAGKAFNDFSLLDNSCFEYDIDIDISTISSIYEELTMFEPFGEGCPEPVVRINNINLKQIGNGEHAFYMGKDKQHIKFIPVNMDNFQLLGFGMADKYTSLGKPNIIDAIGTLSYSESRWGKYYQLIMIDYTHSK